MINYNNEKTAKIRTDKRFSASLVACFALFIGAVTVTSGSAAQAQTQNMTSANNMTSASLAVVTNGLQQQIKNGQDAANQMPNLVVHPFSNGDNK
jgi:hypothetical protein